MELTYRELSTILAGLRLLQETPTHELTGMDHFVDCEPLSDEDIDDLCERLNCDCKIVEEDDGPYEPTNYFGADGKAEKKI
jgi:hypothetical protein